MAVRWEEQCLPAYLSPQERQLSLLLYFISRALVTSTCFRFGRGMGLIRVNAPDGPARRSRIQTFSKPATAGIIRRNEFLETVGAPATKRVGTEGSVSNPSLDGDCRQYLYRCYLRHRKRAGIPSG